MLDAFANTADTLIVCAGMFPRNFVLLWTLRNYLRQCGGTHLPTLRARPLRSQTQAFSRLYKIQKSRLVLPLNYKEILYMRTRSARARCRFCPFFLINLPLTESHTCGTRVGTNFEGERKKSLSRMQLQDSLERDRETERRLSLSRGS